MTRAALLHALLGAYPSARIAIHEVPGYRLEVVVTLFWWESILPSQRLRAQIACGAIVEALRPAHVLARVTLAPVSWAVVFGDVALVLAVLVGLVLVAVSW